MERLIKMRDTQSKSEEFEFVRPEYNWEWQITDIVPHNEKPPVLLLRNGEEVEQHDFTLPFLIERLGINEDYFVPSSGKTELEEQRNKCIIHYDKRMYSAQLFLKQLADKDFILSDRVFKPKDSDIPADSYGFPYMGATTTIGTERHFLSFYWEKQLNEDFFSLSFHNLERDLVRQKNGEWPGVSDPLGEKYLGCLEKAIELCKTKELPPLALIILKGGVSDTLLGRGWRPAILRELRHVGLIPNETYGLKGVDLSLDIDRIQAVKEAYSRLSAVNSTLKEMIQQRYK